MSQYYKLIIDFISFFSAFTFYGFFIILIFFILSTSSEVHMYMEEKRIYKTVSDIAQGKLKPISFDFYIWMAWALILCPILSMTLN